MKIVVTGAFGFIGLAVSKLLLEQGFEVVGCDRKLVLGDRLTGGNHGKRYNDHVMSIVSRFCDVIEPEDLFGTSKNFSCVVHLGAMVDTTGDPQKLLTENFDYTRRLSNTLRSLTLPLVNVSSAAVVGSSGHPDNIYGLSKALAEQFVTSNDHGNKRVVSLRYFNVYGPYEHHKGQMASMPFKICRSYLQGKTFDLFCPDASRDFVYVDDVAAVTAFVAKKMLEAQPPRLLPYSIDVGTGSSVTFDELDRLAQQHSRSIISLARHCDMPESLNGRYQLYTRANPTPLVPKCTTTLHDGIERLITEMRI